MNNDKELLEALLAGKTLTYNNGVNTFTYSLVGNMLESKRDGNTCERALLDIATSLWAIKPETIYINGTEVPMPEKVTPEQDTEYYYPDLDATEEPYYRGHWAEGKYDTARFQKGLIHLTKENAIAHAKALLSFTTEEQ